MEVATGKRELSGEKAQRIVDAMRTAVADRGIAGATFEHVASEAGVSRGLLHYYFGTKERLLVEVVRRDTEIRIERLDAALAGAGSVEGLLDVLVATLLELIENEPSFYLLQFELVSAGRRNPEIGHEMKELFRRTRALVAEALEAKQREGVIRLRFDSGTVVRYLFANADGIAFQALASPGDDHSGVLDAGREAARHLIAPE